MLGALIGMVIGMVIVAIIQANKQSKQRQHAVGVRAAVAAGGEAGRKALDLRLPARRGLHEDADAEGQGERLAALAHLGDLDAIALELQAYQGPALHVASARAVGRLALAVAGRDAEAQLQALEADVAALEAAGTNRLSLRAIGAFVPVVRALARQSSIRQGSADSPGLPASSIALTPAEREEVLRFQSRDAVKKLLRDAFARVDAPPAVAATV